MNRLNKDCYCGLCGHKAVVATIFSLKDNTASHYVYCPFCNAQIRTYDTVEEAKKAWQYKYPTLI